MRAWLGRNWKFAVVVSVWFVIVFLAMYFLFKWILPLPRGGA